MGFRRRVNRGGELDCGIGSSREATIASLKAFSAKLKGKEEKVERKEDEAVVVIPGGDSKRVAVLEMQLKQAMDTVRAAKQMDGELMKANAQLEARVCQLESENEKLYALASYLRKFERENNELRFLLGDLFKPGDVGISGL